ncbi:MAG: hypothetical protein J5725_10295 [Bacteroidales bacterium]|nr:hypothetical protein [Bacteroidales bacterium]
MKPEEAIKIIQEMCLDDRLKYEELVALSVAQDSLSREEPCKMRTYKTAFFCTRCGLRVHKKDTYCPNCGGRLEKQ